MKRLLFVLFGVVCCMQSQAGEVVNINRDWRFFSNSAVSSDQAEIVNLPHTWNNDALSGKNDYYRGVGNYMKQVKIPAEWSNKRVYIRFNGAASVTNLLVNGRHVGEHQGGYTAFTFELSPYLKYGELNSLWAIVNNSQRLDLLPTAGDATVYGGLYRDVELIITEPAHFSVSDYASSGIYLTQRRVSSELAEIDVLMRIDAAPERNLIAKVTLTNDKADTILSQSGRLRIPASGQGTLSLPLSIENPILWHGMLNPYLYRVTAQLYDGERLCDSLTLPLGVRFFSVDPKQGFMLNGEPYRLYGVVAHEDRAGVGQALTPYHVKEDIDLIVEMGANAVRAAAYPHHRAFYEQCDRLGLIVWSDLPFVGPAYMTDKGYIDLESFRTNGKQQLIEMIRQNYNHPSVVMWGVFSQQNLRGDNPVNYIKELNSLAFREDPTRMSVASSNQDGEMNFITNLIVWDHSFGWTEGQPDDIDLWIQQLKSNWGTLRSGVSYGAGASILHQEDSLSRPAYMGNWHPERWQTYLHERYYQYVEKNPMFWGWFVANMFDYGAAGRRWGEGNGVDDRGMVTFDRKYRKDAFYFYKANWNKNEPFVYIAERRWSDRTKPVQTIRIFSNEGSAELKVNGVSQGRREAVNGTLVWENITLREGTNRIDAHTATSTDTTWISITSDKSNHKLK